MAILFDPTRNTLGEASSPYLRQHKDNPVHWQQWSQQAFEYAREYDLVVFVSVGYSTCHWCHVMADGAFSDPTIAATLNRHFVSIKVDREERPDIDSYLMSFLVATTGQGGWPLNAFMSPDQELFFAMTYAPAPSETRAGTMRGFDYVLERVIEFYREKRDELGHFEPRTNASAPGEIEIDRPIALDELPAAGIDLEPMIARVASAFDYQWGGFAGGPKFPPHSTLLWMLYAHAASGDSRLEQMSRTLLDVMADRGLHDHLQGGFYRYCVDNRWTIPHFEKMLYDQAMLLWCYAGAAAHFDDERYRAVADGIVRCLAETFAESHGPTSGDAGRRDGKNAGTPTAGERGRAMPAGGDSGPLLVSAHDADTDHDEGATYLWTREEIRAVLPDDEWDAFSRAFELPGEGNFEGRIHLVQRGESGASAPSGGGGHEATPEPAHDAGRTGDRSGSLAGAVDRLLEIRRARRQPFTDGKIVTSWNALAAIALLQAGRLLDRPQWCAWAEAIASGLRERHDRGDRLAHTTLEGSAGSAGFLEDHAALMLLYTWLGESSREWIEYASALLPRLLAFRDGEGNWIEASHADFRVSRPEGYDHPLPSSISLADFALARYAMLTHTAWAQTEPGEALIRDFWNVSAMARSGLFYLIETPQPPERVANLPINAIRTSGDRTRYCFAGACREGLPER